METLSSKSETSCYTSIHDRSKLISEAHHQPIERRDDDNPRTSSNMPDDGATIEDHSTLKTLLQAPKRKVAMSYDPSKPSMKLTTRWRAESERCGNNNQNSVERSPPQDAVNQRSSNFTSDDNVSQVRPPVPIVPIGQNHTERVTHDTCDTDVKNEESKKETCPRADQIIPLDLSCKDPTKQIQNGGLFGDGGRRLHRMFSSPADLMSPLVIKPESKLKTTAKESAPFDPLFILSQVACEKLTELEQTEPEQKNTGKLKGNKCKKNKKGPKKSKKKSKDKDRDKDRVIPREPDQENAITIEKVENGRVVSESSVQGSSNSHSGNTFCNISEKEIKHENDYPINDSQNSQAGFLSSAQQMPSSNGQGTLNVNDAQGADCMELKQKHQGSVNEKTQAEGMAERQYWPFTCRVCSTRFKNAAFLKIHEKIAHENKIARSDRTGNHIKFVPKLGTSEEVTPKENGIPNPFPIHWKNASVNAGNDVQEQGYTAIPCILKVHRQPPISDTNSTSRTDSPGIEDTKKGFKCKFEADLGGKRAAEILTDSISGSAEFGSQHRRPKLEVDGSSYEIIKVERERTAPNSDNPSIQPVCKGIQHKLFLQICDRNQSGIDSTVKIERDTTVYPTEDSDNKADPNKVISDGNPNQIRVPTSLALKFIPGGDGDSKTGYQHKVYLKIADGNESSIQFKTGTLRMQSPSRVGGTAVKIESTFEHTPRQFHVHDTTRPHKCHYCPKHFPSISALTAHERIHTGEKPYECRFCGRAFYHQNDRRKHERIHTGEKPYECSICGQKFTNKGQVKIHERNHTGERPYQCRHCHKCFKSISNVNRHEKIHTGLKPYTCPVCSRGFSRREHVRTHEEICRKKMLEDDEELADNQIGEVKLPYFRKIDKPEGVVGSMDQPPIKRSKLSEEERRLEDIEKQWAVKQFGAPGEFRRSYSEPFDMYESRTSPESLSRDDKQFDEMSPSLFDSGPPVKPEAEGSAGTCNSGLPTGVDYADGVTARINNDRLKQEDHSSTHGHNVMEDSSRNFYSTNSDFTTRHISPNQHQHVIQETSQAVKSPPVICLPSDKSPKEIVNKNPNDKVPEQHAVASNSFNKPAVVVERIHSTPDNKLSAHIESLQSQHMMASPDKKEPRHYVCGAIAQPEITKLSESIPERHRLRNPRESSASTSKRDAVSMTDLYSQSLKQPPVTIHMKGAYSIVQGSKSPPILSAASMGNQTSAERRCNHQSSPPKLVSLDSGFEEPPALSSPQSVTGFSPGTRSQDDTVPLLLERNKQANNMVEITTAGNLHALQRADLALEALRNAHRAAEFRSAAQPQNSLSN